MEIIRDLGPGQQSQYPTETRMYLLTLPFIVVAANNRASIEVDASCSIAWVVCHASTDF